MPTCTLIDTEYGTLWYHEEPQIVHHCFKKYAFATPFRQILDGGYAALKEHQAVKWLSDDSNNNALTAADEDWCKTDWFVRTKKAGWKHWAIVPPRKLIGEMNLKHFADAYAQLGINAKFFDNAADAMEWLKAQ